MKDDLHFLRLWDLYSPLLTATQREITDLYFNYDLSLGEIAEQKGVSRQSVSDCLQKCRKQLESYDEKLKFDKAITELSHEHSACKATVERWISQQRKTNPGFAVALDELELALKQTVMEFGAQAEPIEDGEILGTVFRKQE